MRNLRKFSSAFFFAFLVAAVMSVGSISLEAAGKRPPKGTVCEYLEAIINWPYTSEYIKAYALSLYSYYGCDAAD